MLRIRSKYFGMFWITIIILMIVFSLCSCTGERQFKKILRKHPEFLVTKEIVRDSISVKDSIIPHHDTLWFPGEKIKIHDTLPCPELNYHRSVTKNNLTATVDIKKGVLNVDCKADSLQKRIDWFEHQLSIYKSQKKEMVKVITVHYATWYDKLCYWFSGISLGVFLFLLGRKYYKVTKL